MGRVAFARHQLFRDRDSARWVLVRFLPGIYGSYDCHARADLLDLHQHRKRAYGPVHAREFHRFPDHFQRPPGERRARSVLVRSLWNYVVGRGRDHCEDLWQAYDATDCVI